MKVQLLLIPTISSKVHLLGPFTNTIPCPYRTQWQSLHNLPWQLDVSQPSLRTSLFGQQASMATSFTSVLGGWV